MRFGGHETFAIREGWLHKGLRTLNENPELFGEDDIADYLGVGRNMGKSIRHWLQATQLAELDVDSSSGRKAILQPTPLGQLVWKMDPFFLAEGTWWILHINLVNNAAFAASWSWFFNSFGHDRFDRAVCVESLKRQIAMSGNKRAPSGTTLEKDLACLLTSYARTVPNPIDDPEDGADCPFRDLGLLSYFTTSGYYQTHHEVKQIAPEVLGYCISRAFEPSSAGAAAYDISITEAARRPGGPGRCFVLTAESLFEVASRAESLSQNGAIQISGMAGDRVIRVKQQSTLDWMTAHYEQIEEGQLHVS